MERRRLVTSMRWDRCGLSASASLMSGWVMLAVEGCFEHWSTTGRTLGLYPPEARRTVQRLPGQLKHLQTAMSIFRGQNCPLLENHYTNKSAWNTGDPVWPLGWEDPLEKGMATHSSVLAWRIPWAEETGGPQPMGLQRVRHDWQTNTFTLINGLLRDTSGKGPTCQCRRHERQGFDPCSGKISCSCLENPWTGAWWATVHRAEKSRTWLKWLSRHTHMQFNPWSRKIPQAMGPLTPTHSYQGCTLDHARHDWSSCTQSPCSTREAIAMRSLSTTTRE